MSSRSEWLATTATTAAVLAMCAVTAAARRCPEGLRDTLAEAFDDPTLDVVYRLEEPEDHWAGRARPHGRSRVVRVRPFGDRGT